jgi:hypothetical protein
MNLEPGHSLVPAKGTVVRIPQRIAGRGGAQPQENIWRRLERDYTTGIPAKISQHRSISPIVSADIENAIDVQKTKDASQCFFFTHAVVPPMRHQAAANGSFHTV